MKSKEIIVNRIIVIIILLLLFFICLTFPNEDVNRDGVVDMKDLVLVKKKIMEMESNN